MSTLQPINTSQPLVEPDRKPARTTTAFLDAIRKRFNKTSALDPDTATLPELIRALQDE